MVQITIDTQQDSPATLQHIIQLLREELQRRGNGEYQPLKVNSSSSLYQTSPSLTPNSENSFTDMFGGNSSSSQKNTDIFGSNTDSPVHSAQPSQDMFSVFSHDAPKETTTLSSETEPFITSHMTQEGMNTPSATQLLEEDDVHDVTEDLARQVWQKGSTRKPKTPFNIEPY